MHISFNLFLFKKAIEEELNIVEWNPNTEQLGEMRDEILKLNGDEDIFAVEKNRFQYIQRTNKTDDFQWFGYIKG
ncbi:hypothetical protein [Pantoea ananatis]|uniref:hypothetical protein n=1 Tax=Pantoea ananas TaxID=553 RepID=UPI001FF0B948|nr:hypothetical protein [Pantoea ananatis]